MSQRVASALHWAALVCLGAACMWNLSTFENAADIYFFMRIRVFLDLWLASHSTPPAAVLRLPCEQMSAVFTSQQPIIFEGCIPKNIDANDMAYFLDEQQNLFPPCNKKRLRHFSFVGADNSSKAIVEDVPCAPSTLREKLASFEAHHTERDGDYFEVHTRLTSAAEEALLAAALHDDLLLPSELDTRRMVVPTLTHFLHAGRTAVYYLHAHMDRFLSFCLQEQKTWVLIAPHYLHHFESTWSGNAQMMLREREATPRIEIRQRRGDVLFVPPWWIHETKVRPGKKNIGVNIHWLAEGQLLGYAARLHARLLGNAAWFYSTP